ncbi:MAG: phytanoyl-CoA dioxygenase family protein [Bryobacteraceae bacterium]|nr:phytanoyl-CoA dioxygenase family protein [Bryobacteraceae bacterium]
MGQIADQRIHTWRMPSMRAEHFPGSGPYPWLDRPDALDNIAARRATGAITEYEAAQAHHWVRDGYVVLPGLIAADTLDTVWRAYQQAVDRGRIVLEPEPAGEGDAYPGRFLNPHRRVSEFCRVAKHSELLRWVRFLLEREPKVLQTIASHKGSQQPEHSDSIHMTTYPLGYLVAAWIAFEDIHPDSGPLVYYPGSHRWPYLFSHDVKISEDEFRRDGYQSYQAKYEPKIRELIASQGIAPVYFHARRGDVLLWHANLVHGGSARRDLAHSRRAVVTHYFGQGAFVYHDLAATRSKQQYVSTCLLRG